MKHIKLLSTVLLSSTLLISPMLQVQASVTEEHLKIALIDSEVPDEDSGIRLQYGASLADLPDSQEAKDGTLYVDRNGRRTVEVRNWGQFASAVNNRNVSVINVASSFSSGWVYSLDTISRSLSINFINNSTITMDNNHPFIVTDNGILEFSGTTLAPMLITDNQVRQPLIQGSPSSTIRFSGSCVIGNVDSRLRGYPIVSTSGALEIFGNSTVVMNEAIQATHLRVLNSGKLEVNTKNLSPIRINANGDFLVEQYGVLRVIHAGNNPAIYAESGTDITINNPNEIYLAQDGAGGTRQPLIASTGGTITINAVNNAFWRTGSYDSLPSQVWNQNIQAQLIGVNGNQVLDTALDSFRAEFLGFSQYRKYSAGMNAQMYPETSPAILAEREE